MKKLKRPKSMKNAASDLLILVGFALLSAGAAVLHAAAGLIVGGTCCLVLGYLIFIGGNSNAS